jgi:hypothetical protein
MRDFHWKYSRKVHTPCRTSRYIFEAIPLFLLPFGGFDIFFRRGSFHRITWPRIATVPSNGVFGGGSGRDGDVVTWLWTTTCNNQSTVNTPSAHSTPTRPTCRSTKHPSTISKFYGKSLRSEGRRSHSPFLNDKFSKMTKITMKCKRVVLFCDVIRNYLGNL